MKLFLGIILFSLLFNAMAFDALAESVATNSNAMGRKVSAALRVSSELWNKRERESYINDWIFENSDKLTIQHMQRILTEYQQIQSIHGENAFLTDAPLKIISSFVTGRRNHPSLQLPLEDLVLLAKTTRYPENLLADYIEQNAYDYSAKEFGGFLKSAAKQGWIGRNTLDRYDAMFRSLLSNNINSFSAEEVIDSATTLQKIYKETRVKTASDNNKEAVDDYIRNTQKPLSLTHLNQLLPLASNKQSSFQNGEELIVERYVKNLYDKSIGFKNNRIYNSPDSVRAFIKSVAKFVPISVRDLVLRQFILSNERSLLPDSFLVLLDSLSNQDPGLVKDIKASYVKLNGDRLTSQQVSDFLKDAGDRNEKTASAIVSHIRDSDSLTAAGLVKILDAVGFSSRTNHAKELIAYYVDRHNPSPKTVNTLLNYINHLPRKRNSLESTAHAADLVRNYVLNNKSILTTTAIIKMKNLLSVHPNDFRVKDTQDILTDLLVKSPEPPCALSKIAQASKN